MASRVCIFSLAFKTNPFVFVLFLLIRMVQYIMEKIRNVVATLDDGDFPGRYTKGVQLMGVLLDIIDDGPHAFDEHSC